MTFAGLIEVFLIGIATPLTAACVLPLYPAFIGYLASVGDDAPSGLLLGILVVLGVLVFMGLVGVVFATLLETSITSVVGIVSPVAFAVLTVIGVVLVVDPTLFSRVPVIEPPHTRSPLLSAFGYGFFFGAIVIPCNPGLIALFFARTPVLFNSYLGNLLGFVSFGIGMGTPLLAFAVVSETHSRRLTRWLAAHSTPINRGVGVILIVVSLYYLVIVFQRTPLV